MFYPDRVDGEQFYYGKRDTMYFFSSQFVIAVVCTYGALWFRKKILGIYETRKEALAKEIALHHRLQVKTHSRFFNRAHQRFQHGAHTRETISNLVINQAMLGKPISPIIRTKFRMA